MIRQPRADKVAPPARTGRLPMVWAVLIVLLLLLGTFCYWVASPLLATNSAAKRCQADSERMPREIRDLGGEEAACRKLISYLRLFPASPKMRLAAIRMLGHCGHFGVTPLRELARSANPDVRGSATTGLATIGKKAEEAVPDLILLLDDEDYEVRLGAAWALGKIGRRPERSVKPLIRSLADKDYRVRFNAANALGDFGPRAAEAVDPLRRLLKDEHVRVRVFAARALGQIGAAAESSVAELIQSAERDDDLVGLFATESLGKLGSESAEAVDGLRRLEKQGNAQVRSAARRALEKIKKAQEEKKNKKPVEPPAK